jgi:hypothetical protein
MQHRVQQAEHLPLHAWMTSYNKERINRNKRAAETNPKAMATQQDSRQVKHDISIVPTHKKTKKRRENQTPRTSSNIIYRRKQATDNHLQLFHLRT